VSGKWRREHDPAARCRDVDARRCACRCGALSGGRRQVDRGAGALGMALVLLSTTLFARFGVNFAATHSISA